MAHLDHFLRQYAEMQQQESSLTLSNKEIPDIAEWQNGQIYDVTLTHRGVQVVSKIFTGNDVVVVLKLKGQPIYQAFSAQNAALEQFKRMFPGFGR